MSLRKLMNWITCGRTDGVRHREPARRYRGLPYVGTLSNGADVYSDKSLDPERESTPDCIYFAGGDHYGVTKNKIHGGRLEIRMPGGSISLSGGTFENNTIIIE